MNAPAFRPPPIARVDFWRASPHDRDLAPGYKEWSHFSILAPHFDLVFNLSFVRDPASERVTPRVIVLFGDDEDRWDGDFINVPLAEAVVAPGAPDAALGPAFSRLRDGRYCIEAHVPRRDLHLAFDLEPKARALSGYAVRLCEGEALHWVCVPHLRASGFVRAGGRLYETRDAPAYHDRNWGAFAWGGDYAWEWATLVPDDPAMPALVFSRMSDRARGLTLSQSLMIWRDGKPSRRYYGRDLKVSLEGALRPARVFRLPRFTGLLGSGTAADVPRRLRIAARAYGDSLDIEIDLERFGQILAPNDQWPGLTALSEAGGRFALKGHFDGRPLAFTGRTQAEFKHAAA